MEKETNLKITVHLPQDHKAESLQITKDGYIRIFDKSGQEIIPPTIERTACYDREKGPKHQSKTTIDNVIPSVSGLNELAQYERIIAIDTNSININNRKVSAAFFIVCRLIPDQKGYRIISLDGLAHVYEFYDVVVGNPEMLAILKIANDTVRGGQTNENTRIVFITDSELASHQSISKQELPIYGQHYLPKRFSLNYASTDTGKEVMNQLIKCCDRESKKHLSKLKEMQFQDCGFQKLTEDPSISWRYCQYSDLEIFNPIATGFQQTDKTTFSVKFINGDGQEIPRGTP